MGTRLGTFGEVAYALAPKAVDEILHMAYKVFPDSAAARGEEDPEEKASTEPVALAHLRGSTGRAFAVLWGSGVVAAGPVQTGDPATRPAGGPACASPGVRLAATAPPLVTRPRTPRPAGGAMGRAAPRRRSGPVATASRARACTREGLGRRRAIRSLAKHDNNRGPGYSECQHDRHRPGRHARPRPALPAPGSRRVGRPRRAYAYLLYRRRERLATRPASGCRRSSTRRSWGPASRSRWPTSRSAARATSWAASSPVTWRPSGSTSTRGCSPRRSRSARRAARIGAPVVEKPQAVVDLPVEAHLPDDYVPEEAQKLELYRRLARAPTAGRPGRLPPGADGPVRADAGSRSSGSSRSPSCG